MKRRMVFCAVLVCLAVLASPEVYAGADFKIGVDNSGTYEVTPAGTSKATPYDVNSGSSMSFEGFTTNNTADIGFGFEWQSGRALTKSTGGTFNFMPIYLFMRMHPKELSSFSPYLAIQVGMAAFNGDDKFKGYSSSTKLQSGNHLGIGVGAIMDKKFLMELLMTQDTGSVSVSGSKVADIKYKKTTFSIGVYF